MASIFVPDERGGGETRVAATPSTVRKYVAAGLSVSVVRGAGSSAGFPDDAYAEAGADLVGPEAVGEADLVIRLTVPAPDDIAAMKPGASLVSFLWAREHLDRVAALTANRISAYAMDAVPRITRAQKLDARSSQANLAGYQAVLVAATHLHRTMPLLMTAAGTLPPAKVVVIGAGVAGLQAVATAKRLGAKVEVSDVRPEVKEQVASLGATYIEVETDEDLSGEGGYAKEQSEAFRAKQQQVLEEHLVAADAIVCTALIPYRPAPRIVSEDVVSRMRAGSVVVDLAAERGGNCACTVAGEVVEVHGVTVVGTLAMARHLATDASEMYAANVCHLVLDQVGEGTFAWNTDDEVVDKGLVTLDGEVRDPGVREAMGHTADAGGDA